MIKKIAAIEIVNFWAAAAAEEFNLIFRLPQKERKKHVIKSAFPAAEHLDALSGFAHSSYFAGNQFNQFYTLPRSVGPSAACFSKKTVMLVNCQLGSVAEELWQSLSESHFFAFVAFAALLPIYLSLTVQLVFLTKAN